MKVLLARFIISILLTIIIESAIGLSLLHLLKIKHNKVLSLVIFVCINLFTLPLGYALYNWIHISWLIVELSIIIVEGLIIWALFRTSPQKAALISLATNGTTMLIALILAEIL